MLSLITAYDERGAIGRNGDLPWGRALPADLAHFRELTLGKRIIMGRKTLESLGNKPLPGRENVVISHGERSMPPGVFLFGSLATALAFKRLEASETFVIGGAQLYEAALPYADRIYATEIHAVFPGADTFFPNFSADQWREVACEQYTADERNAYDYDFVLYERNQKTA